LWNGKVEDFFNEEDLSDFFKNNFKTLTVCCPRCPQTFGGFLVIRVLTDMFIKAVCFA
jgi:hypothetical protein